MCGISGLYGRRNAAILARMNAVQSHRGPDDTGTWEHCSPDGTWIGLGSRRLAILDLSPAGHMPMVSEDGKLSITYNGEIYNSPELRRELESAGEKFRSHSDTEVILRLFAREGAACLRRLNGMFAFAICDLRKNSPEIFLARDHFGIKPLYYTNSGGQLAFASEMKALLELPDFPRRLDAEALECFLTFLWVPEPNTILKDVHKMPAGHYGTFAHGTLKLTRFWDPNFPPMGQTYPMPEAELAGEIKERFFTAVRRQMLSDVPVGTFLSAGLDSSAILAAMAHASKEPVRTFTVTFPPKYRVGEKNLDDPAVAARTASHFGACHHEIVVEPNAAELLPKLIWHMDDPVADPAIITAFYVCQQARRNSTVLLSGTGGDEVFGGYRKYQASLAARHYQKLPRVLRERMIEPLIRQIPPLSHTPLKAYANWARKWAKSASLDPVSQFIMNATYFDGAMRAELLQESTGVNVAARHHDAFAKMHSASSLNRMLYVDCKLFLPSLNLNYNDKMGMAASLETRVPYLDIPFFEWVSANVPPTLKVKGRITKYIFRQAMKGVLPEEVLRQPKASFGAPVGYWLEHDLREMTADLLSTTQIRSRGWFEPNILQKMINEHRSGTRDWGMQIWQFLTLELWAQRFLS